MIVCRHFQWLFKNLLLTPTASAVVYKYIADSIGLNAISYVELALNQK